MMATKITVDEVTQNVTVTVSNERGPAGQNGGGSWGTITGTLSSQTDLQAALDLKAPLESPTFTGTVTADHIHGNLAGSVYLHIRAGEALSKGDPVYVSGSHGTGSAMVPIVMRADASNPAKMPAIAIMDAAVANSGSGHAVINGTIADLNTAAYSINSTLYVANGGGMTATKPTNAQPVARVERSNANNGGIVVKVNGLYSDISPANIGAAPATGIAPSAITGTAVVTSDSRLASAIQKIDPSRELDLPSHDNSLTCTHPSVVDFGPSRWNGYRYWMAYTPWPSGSREVPNIVASNNLVDWVVPAGLVNPIATHTTVNAALGSSLYGYLADTELVVTADSRLRCYYIASNLSPARTGVIMQESSDGITWTTPVRVINDTTNARRLLSPTVVRDGSNWYMWVIDRDTSLAEINRVRRYTSTDGVSWTGPVNCTIPSGPLIVPFHVYVHFVNNLYHMLLATDGNEVWNSPLLYFQSTDGLSWTGDPNVPAVKPVGTYDGERFYRSCMIPADAASGTWHVFASGLPLNHTFDGVIGEPWRIGLRPNLHLENVNNVSQNSFGISTTSLSLKWKSNKPVAPGASVDICRPSTEFIEEAACAQVKAEIWGKQGTSPIGGVWLTGSFSPTLISAALTTTTRFSGAWTPNMTMSALPNNVTPVSGDVITGATSGATAQFHRVRNTTPPQYSLRNFSGTAIFQVGEQLRIGGVTLTNGGTPVTVSSLATFPAANAINLVYVDSAPGFPGRYQIWNSFAAAADVAVELESNR